MKDKEIKIRADEEFVQKVEYLQQINGYKNRSETVRKIVEKEWRKEHGCISCPYAYMVKDSEGPYHDECGITHKKLSYEDLVLNPIDCPRWNKGEGKVTLSEALAEADREWEAKVIPNGKEMDWNGHKLRFELSPSNCVGCFFKDKNECPNCDDGAWVEDSPWHTGTPTEEGRYIAVMESPLDEPFYVIAMLRKEPNRMVWHGNIEPLAWQKITPYEEKEDVGTK